MLYGIVYVLFDFGDCSIVDERAVCYAILVSGTDFEVLDLFCESLCEVVVDARLDVDSHVWPEPRNLEAMAPFTAKSKSASLKTMNGALPPSSKESFLSVSADCFISSLPTLVDPVKDTFRTVSEDVRASPTSAVFSKAVTIFTTPGGMPARCASSASAAAVKGVSPGDLATMVQPAARAGPILRVIMAAGKFHLDEIQISTS